MTSAVAYFTIIIYHPKCFYSTGQGAKAIKLFATVIYYHSMVILSICVITLYHLGNYHQMAAYDHGKMFITFDHGGKIKLTVEF